MEKNADHTGWAARQSIALELDLAIAVINGAILPRGATSLTEFAPILHALPSSWTAELEELLRDARGFRGSLEMLALLSDQLFETDYSRATLAMRELTLPAIAPRLEELAREADPALVAGTYTGDQPVDLFERLQLSLFQDVDIQINRKYQETQRGGFEFIQRLVQGGDLHDRFWHWLDRFYYEAYAPWRVGRQPWLDEQEAQALAALGSLEKSGVAPVVEWMSEMSPVLRHPGIKAAVEAGTMRLYLWVEPFAIPDAWVMIPHAIVSTFARPGATIRHFMNFTDDLARRLAAVSDPTRLIILRMIRNMDMTNTDMADYLKLSRPTVSIHARLLREAGLIRSHQEGRVVRHEIIPEEVHKMLHELESFLDLPEE